MKLLMGAFALAALLIVLQPANAGLKAIANQTFQIAPFVKLLAAPTNAPGAGVCVNFFVAGTNGGTCKEQAMCGTSTTPVTIIDNVGSGC